MGDGPVFHSFGPFGDRPLGNAAGMTVRHAAMPAAALRAAQPMAFTAHALPLLIAEACPQSRRNCGKQARPPSVEVHLIDREEESGKIGVFGTSPNEIGADVYSPDEVAEAAGVDGARVVQRHRDRRGDRLSRLHRPGGRRAADPGPDRRRPAVVPTIGHRRWRRSSRRGEACRPLPRRDCCTPSA